MERRKPKSQLTPLELKVMKVLWQAGPSNVQAVQKGLRGELAYTTVQTVLNVLKKKGHVDRALVGRAYEYRPVQAKEKTLGSAVHDLLNRMFDGSVEGLMMTLVRTKQVDPAKLAELAQRVADAEGEADAEFH
jgi:BlaI family transcriptional regulator, penicillinase repressor